jgi:hypothetical protein
MEPVTIESVSNTLGIVRQFLGTMALMPDKERYYATLGILESMCGIAKSHINHYVSQAFPSMSNEQLTTLTKEYENTLDEVNKFLVNFRSFISS